MARKTRKKIFKYGQSAIIIEIFRESRSKWCSQSQSEVTRTNTRPRKAREARGPKPTALSPKPAAAQAWAAAGSEDKTPNFKGWLRQVVSS